jgi:uncharacterized protein YcfL
MKMLCLILATFTLVACQGDAQTRATSSLAIACESVASILDQLTPRRVAGQLSADAVSKVNSTKAVTDKACLPNSPFDPAKATAIVENAITILKGI